MKTLILSFTLFFCNYQLVWAFPSRPSSASCRDLVPLHGGTPRNLGFRLLATEGATFTPGGPSVLGM